MNYLQSYLNTYALMGIVIRQSFWTSVISYIGVVLGYVNLLYLYPRFLEADQIGLLRTIQDGAILLASFAQVGLSQTIVRYHPQLGKDSKSSQGFINLIFLISFCAFIVFLLLFSLFRADILSFFNDQRAAMEEYMYLILWLTFILVLITLTESLSRSFLKISMPSFLREVGIRFLQGILVLIYFMGWISFKEFLVYSVGIYVISLLALISYLIAIGNFKFSLSILSIPKGKLTEILKYSAMSFAGASALLTIIKLDSLMVTALTVNGFVQNAIYTTAFYMATVIEVPRRAIGQASSILISRAFEKNDIQEVESIYKKTTINQFIIGSLLFIGLVSNLENIFSLIPKSEIYEQGFNVVIIVGIIKMVDMFFGPNGEIIVMSKYYWFHTAILLVMIVVSVVLNLLLIPQLGIDGAAIASAITYILFNIIKSIFVHKRLNIHPFTLGCLTVSLIGVFTYGVNLALPTLEKVYFDIVYRSTIITLVFTVLIFITKPSTEIDGLFTKAATLFKSYLKIKP